MSTRATNFGEALAGLRQGQRVARAGWNGRGMYLLQASGGTFRVDGRVEGELSPFIVMRTVQGDFVPWLASQTDVLAEDWQCVPKEER